MTGNLGIFRNFRNFFSETKLFRYIEFWELQDFQEIRNLGKGLALKMLPLCVLYLIRTHLSYWVSKVNLGGIMCTILGNMSQFITVNKDTKLGGVGGTLQNAFSNILNNKIVFLNA